MKVLEKIIGIAIFVISVFMLVNGIINNWTGHILFGVIGLFAGVAVFWWCLIENSPIHDEKTNRFYKYAKESDNPKRAICPKCKDEDALVATMRPLIHSVYGDKKYHGVYCWFHGEMWFDKEDL